MSLGLGEGALAEWVAEQAWWAGLEGAARRKARAIRGWQPVSIRCLEAKTQIAIL